MKSPKTIPGRPIPDAKIVTVNYYDLTGTKVTTQTINSVYNADIKVVPTIPDNYVLMDNQNTNLHVNLQDNELDLVIVPTTTTQQESKTIQRIITINRPDHQSPLTVTQTVKFTRQKITNNISQTYHDLPTGFHIVNGQNPNAGAMLIPKDQQPLSNKVEYVTRTITIVMPNGKSRKITQKARKGTNFPKPAIPRIKDYTINLDINKLNNVTADTNTEVTIIFSKIA